MYKYEVRENPRENRINKQYIPYLKAASEDLRKCLIQERKNQENTCLPLGLALGSPIFPSGCEGKLGVALESPQSRRDLT